MITPRPYQSQGITDIRTAYAAGKKRVMYVLSTGGGKSLIFGLICYSLHQKKKSALVLVHRGHLLDQTSKMLTSMGIDHGTLMGGKHSRTLSSIVVGGVMSVVRRFDKLPDYDLIVCDEAHLSMASTYQQIYANWPNAFILGVTATPERLDGKGFTGSYDEMIIGPSTAWLIENGYLSPYKAYAPKTAIDISQIKITRGEYDEKEVEEKFGSSVIIGDAVSHYTKFAHKKPTIAFCVSISHAIKVAEQFTAAGYNATHIEGAMNDAQRNSILRGLANGKWDVVTSCKLVSEGLDIPMCVGVIYLNPTKSVVNALQWPGRALRPVYADGYDLSTVEGRLDAIANGPKPYAIILDHAGILFEHGLPDDEREWTLEGKKKTKKKSSAPSEAGVNLRHCPECFAIHARAPECPRCHHVYVVKGRTPKTEDGELVEVDATHIKKQRIEMNREVGMAKTEEELKRIAKARGYKPSWVYYVMKSRNKKGTKS